MDKYPVWFFPKFRWILIPTLLLLLLFSGCAPKRVVHGRVETKSSLKDASRAVPEEERSSFETSPTEKRRTVTDPVGGIQLGLKVAALAQGQLDKPYQWGAEGPEMFDCSGLVYYVFGSLDISLPRVSHEQAKVGSLIKKSQLQPGDLLFFITEKNGINHVGIYVGDSRFVHAPSGYGRVSYDSLDNPYWRKVFQFGRRISG